MYAFVELLDKTVFDQFGINYPPNQVVNGLLCGAITRDEKTFLILYNEDKEFTAYSTQYYSVMFVEIDDSKYKFPEEPDTVAASSAKRYLFADCSVKDQEAMVLECKKYVEHREVAPTSKLCPGCFNPLNDMVTLPNRWKRDADTKKFLPGFNDFEKAHTYQRQTDYVSKHTDYTYNTPYVAPKKSVSVFKRKGKLEANSLKEMRDKVAKLNAQLLKEEADLAESVDNAVAGLQLNDMVDKAFRGHMEAEY